LRERERERKRECLMGIIRLMSRWGLFLGHGGDGPTHERARLPACFDSLDVQRKCCCFFELSL